MQFNVATALALTTGIAADTDPACIVYKDTLYVFYVGTCPGGVLGVWYMTSSDGGDSWEPTASVRLQATNMGVLAGTNPSVAELNGTLYLFYAGNGKDGIYYTTFTNGNWAQVQKVSATGIILLAGTSPSAAVFNGTLYLFYAGSGNDGIWYTTLGTQANASWTSIYKIQNDAGTMNVAGGTSPTAITYQSRLYLFYSVNDSATQANLVDVWYTSVSVAAGAKWSAVASIRNQMPVQALSMMSGTSPGVFFCGWDGLLYVFWNGSAGNGLFYCAFNGAQWSSQVSMQSNMPGGGAVGNQANPVPLVYGFMPYVFWWGGSASAVSYTSLQVLNPATDLPAIMTTLFANGSCFVSLQNNPQIQAFLSSLANVGVPPALPGPDPDDTDATDDSYDDYGDSGYADDGEYLRLLQQGGTSLANITQNLPPIPVFTAPPSSSFSWDLLVVLNTLLIGSIVLYGIYRGFGMTVSASLFPPRFELALIPPAALAGNMQPLLPL